MNVDRCGYCDGPLERIDISSFGEGVVRSVYGRCENRCIPPACVCCSAYLSTDGRCENVDCPVAFVIQPCPTGPTP